MAKTMKLNQLKKQYEIVVSEYIQKFCNKQELDFEYWVGNDIGGIACFGDIHFLPPKLGIKAQPGKSIFPIVQLKGALKCSDLKILDKSLRGTQDFIPCRRRMPLHS